MWRKVLLFPPSGFVCQWVRTLFIYYIIDYINQYGRFLQARVCLVGTEGSRDRIKHQSSHNSMEPRRWKSELALFAPAVDFSACMHVYLFFLFTFFATAKRCFSDCKGGCARGLVPVDALGTTSSWLFVPFGFSGWHQNRLLGRQL